MPHTADMLHSLLLLYQRMIRVTTEKRRRRYVKEMKKTLPPWQAVLTRTRSPELASLRVRLALYRASAPTLRERLFLTLLYQKMRRMAMGEG